MKRGPMAMIEIHSSKHGQAFGLGAHLIFRFTQIQCFARIGSSAEKPQVRGRC